MLYRFGRGVCLGVVHGLRGMAVSGRENVPAYGGLVVAANHVSYWDPVVVGCALSRQVFFMAKRELFTIPVLGLVIRGVGGLPVDRRRTTAGTIKLAGGLLKEGKVLGVFPEGTRNRTDRLLEPQLGAFLLAASAQAPILPVAIAGSRGVVGRIRVYIGEVIPPPAREAGRSGLVACGREWARRIDRLLGRV